MLINFKYKYLKNFLSAILFIAIPLLAGCTKSKVIDEDKFIKVYSNLVISQDTTNITAKNIDSVKAKVYKKYNITDEEYKATINYYNQDPERWEKFFTKAIAYVESLKKQKGK